MNEDRGTPTYSYWPLALALGMVMTAIGVVSTAAVSVFGVLLLFASIIGWTWENRNQEKENDGERG